MGTSAFLLVFCVFFVIQIDFLTALYMCGIRRHALVPLENRDSNVEDGQWPWHVALFHKTSGGSSEYACGGTLISQKHILTAAYCVVNRDTRYPFPAANIELHFGQQNLSTIADHTQIRDVSEVQVHPEYSSHRNDIAVLVIRLPVDCTDYVIPICLGRQADKDPWNLEGKRGRIPGWGTTMGGTISDEPRTVLMPVVSYRKCLSDDHMGFSNLLNPNVYCAGDINGTSPGMGYNGGGLYFTEGDRWVLRGILAFAKVDETKAEIDTSKFKVFVNVQRYLMWIKKVMDEYGLEAERRSKRMSEMECDRYKNLAMKRANGGCSNSRYPHTVSLTYPDGNDKCTGVLVNENHVISSCHCMRDDKQQGPAKVRIETFNEVDILSMTCHPCYRDSYNDLAVVKLATSITLSSRLIPACLASNWTENLYDTLLQTGFASYDGIKTFIESDENQIITKKECGRLVPSIMPNQLCVINNDKFRTKSKGFSGSLLQSVNSRSCMFTAVGIMSSSIQDSKRDRESNGTVIDIYTRLSYHLDWIEQMVWNVGPPMESTSTRC